MILRVAGLKDLGFYPPQTNMEAAVVPFSVDRCLSGVPGGLPCFP